MAETQLAVVAQEKQAGESDTTLTPSIAQIDQYETWPTLSRMQIKLSVRIALNRIRVKDLLQLQRGQVLLSQFSHTDDVPLTAGELLLAWSEFEVAGQRLGVRLTQSA